MRFHGIERSHGSIRDLADISDGTLEILFNIAIFLPLCRISVRLFGLCLFQKNNQTVKYNDIA